MLPLDLPYGDPDAIRHRGFNNDSPLTRLLTRGVCRLLREGPVTEFRRPNGRRVDVMALGPGSEFLTVEVKSISADFRGAALHREVPERSINPTRRRSHLLRFGLTASDWLQRLTDPGL
mgnify:CR=1 FL=1